MPERGKKNGPEQQASPTTAVGRKSEGHTYNLRYYRLVRAASLAAFSDAAFLVLHFLSYFLPQQSSAFF